jgi:poly(A) polymerase
MNAHTGEVFETLCAAGYSLSLSGFSALDAYMGLPPLPFVWAETNADISALARLFDIRFPGVELADAALEAEGRTWYFRCPDPEELFQSREFPRVSEKRRPAYSILSLTQDWKTKRFRDPRGIYPLIRELRDGSAESSAEPWWAGADPRAEGAVMDGALILARYGPARPPEAVKACLNAPFGPPPSAENQRVLLTSLMVSSRPELGLELLKASGFIAGLWPELALLDDVDHSKEFHPEGNGWNHTLETFQYRKAGGIRTGGAHAGGIHAGAVHDLRLSLGLLLHDVGKPRSEAAGSHRFEGHAELGAWAARKFLERLEFDPPLINDVCYLVKNHMLPAALPRLPFARTGEILESPLFPTLLELYRCDESSSFKGPDGYYESSAAYQAYLRYRRNPYRSADGRKLGKTRSASVLNI